MTSFLIEEGRFCSSLVTWVANLRGVFLRGAPVRTNVESLNLLREKTGLSCKYSNSMPRWPRQARNGCLSTLDCVLFLPRVNSALIKSVFLATYNFLVILINLILRSFLYFLLVFFHLFPSPSIFKSIILGEVICGSSALTSQRETEKHNQPLRQCIRVCAWLQKCPHVKCFDFLSR